MPSPCNHEHPLSYLKFRFYRNMVSIFIRIAIDNVYQLIKLTHSIPYVIITPKLINSFGPLLPDAVLPFFPAPVFPCNGWHIICI